MLVGHSLGGYLSLLASLAERQAELAHRLETGAMTDTAGPAFNRPAAGEGHAPFSGNEGEQNAATDRRQPPLYLETAGLAAVLGPLIKQIVHAFPVTSPAVVAALERLAAADVAATARWLEALLSAASNPDDVAVLPC